MGRLDTELLGLQIVSLDTAAIVGEIDGLIVDDLTMTVAGFLVDLGLYEAKVLPFDAVKAIGSDAVIVERAAAVRPITSEPRLENLAGRDITISFAKAITKSGRNVGTIGDFVIDTDTGSILGVELLVSVESDDGELEAQFLAASAVYKLGRDVVVLSDDLTEHTVADATLVMTPTYAPAPVEPATPPTEAEILVAPPTEEPTPADAPVEAVEERAPSDGDLPEDTVTDLPAPDLEEPGDMGTPGTVAEAAPAEPPEESLPNPAEIKSPAPRHFLLGKRVLRRIETPDGNVIAEADETVTFDIIQKAKAADQLLILSLNVE